MYEIMIHTVLYHACTHTQGIAGYPGQIPVAVKTLSSRNSQQRAMFIEEAELLRNFCHQNIVSLLGMLIVRS